MFAIISAMTRQELVLSAIDYSLGTGLEIGPLTSPILSKTEANIYYADHMSREQLKIKYKKAPVELDKIAPVDFVVKRTLIEAVGDARFDYVIACHVIEHIPDTIRWLNDIASILKPGGILALAIPDKRFTFDIMRHPSTPGDIVGAYLDRQTRPSSAAMYDFASEARVIKSKEVWARPLRDWSSKPHLFTPANVAEMCETNLKPTGYVDSHCLVFTPASFIKILRVLMQDGLTDFEVADFHDTNDQNIEFYVSLRKVRTSNAKRKMQKQLASLPRIPNEVTIQSLKRANDTLNDQLRALESELTALRNSKSWKMSAPLRAAARQIKRPEQ